MKTPVLIVGGGPVGLAMAGDLGWRGISCVAIEKSDGAVTQPKMDLVHVRTMEFCRRWGIVPWVESAGYNRDYPQDYAWVTKLQGGFEIGREPFPSCRDEAPPPQSPQKRERCPQNFFDPVLQRFVQSTGKVSQHYYTELVDFAEHADGVTATVVDHRSGERREIDAAYMVACDGAGSMIRDRLGIGLSGNTVLTYTTNAIFRCRDFERLHDKKPAYRYLFIGPEGTWATIVAINGTDQWRFSLIGDETRRPLSESDVRAAILRAVGRDFDFELLSLLPWTRRELVADSYGTQRIFLVGDSAHQLSPTGAFGMNTGIQEAVDLSWKLAAMIEGWGGASLLDSYEEERRPIAARNVHEAAGNLKRMQSLPPRDLFEEGAAGDAARRRFGAQFTETMKREWFTIGIQLGYHYENSPLCVPDGTAAPPDEVSSYVPTARPGHRAPHGWLAPGQSTLDLFGRGFVLLRLGAAPPAVTGLRDAAAASNVPLRVVDIASRATEALYERRLVLVRPDGHVAWRGDREPGEPGRVIDVVRGAAALGLSRDRIAPRMGVATR